MRAVLLGLFGFVVGFVAMYWVMSGQFHWDAPTRLLVSVGTGVVVALVGYFAARSQTVKR